MHIMHVNITRIISCNREKGSANFGGGVFFLMPRQPFWAKASSTKFLDHTEGHAVAKLVEALCYKPEDRGFDSRWCHWNFSLT
jgi:hypothetical protein